MTDADCHSENAVHQRLGELRAMIRSGNAVLFTGAGFSAEAKDHAGRPLPDAREMVADLWEILYPGEPDDSSLCDLYDAALVRAPEALRAYLDRRLKIGDAPLSRSFARWFSAPWARVYTLNVDDLEAAVMRQFDLPRALVPRSALAPRERCEDGLEVIHLNGIAGDAAEDVTFSTLQYASRLCAPDREYERLVEDLRTRPFVFVGTTLDEVVLWKHVQLERAYGKPLPHRHSFLIAPQLGRARRDLLESVHIHWIEATAAQIADAVLSA